MIYNSGMFLYRIKRKCEAMYAYNKTTPIHYLKYQLLFTAEDATVRSSQGSQIDFTEGSLLFGNNYCSTVTHSWELHSYIIHISCKSTGVKSAQISMDLTLNARGPSYLGLTSSISWLLMPWLLTSPGHQQPWYWLHRICRSWSYSRKDFKYLCHIIVE